MEKEWLPGEVRERIRDLIKSKNITQAKLAGIIGIDKSTLSRYMSGNTDKLSNESIEKMAAYFGVSTDFLLGLTREPERTNYDIGELGLTVQAAKNLYLKKADPAIVSELLENSRFDELTQQIAVYKKETFSAGITAHNQLLSTIGTMLLSQGRQNPEDAPAANEARMLVRSLHQPVQTSETDAMQQNFLHVLQELKKDTGLPKQSALMTKEVMRNMLAEMKMNGPGMDLHTVSPDQIIGGILQPLAIADVPQQYAPIMEEAVSDLKTGLQKYFSVLQMAREAVNAE